MPDPAAPRRAKADGRSTYGVKQVRGPFVRLDPHPAALGQPTDLVHLVERIRAAEPSKLIAADLFSGAGGLSLGMRSAGIETVLAVDTYKEAVETHRHHFPGLTLDWDLSTESAVQRVGNLLRECDVDVVMGGPPCQPFSKAGRSGIRHYVRTGVRPEVDQRKDLWQAFLEVVRLSRPRAVVMENVPDMALDREMLIVRTMSTELEALGYGVHVRVVDTWRYGVPQFRQRLILVALLDGLSFVWPRELQRKNTVHSAIGDLPDVEGGWRPDGGADGWTPYGGPITDFQKEMREGVPQGDENKVFDHITRPVRDDDREAFEYLDSNTRYSELPDHLKRYRDDIFDDKYKRLDANDLSRTITAHIAKDGYWYIHPTQHRTLTVREAARLQTFPDWFRFAGPPSAAFRQIGNAVPPKLGSALGMAIRDAFSDCVPTRVATSELSSTLASWFSSLGSRLVPWLAAETRWQVVSAELLLDKATLSHVTHIWPLLERWSSPVNTIENADGLRSIGRLIGREHRAERVVKLAEAHVAIPDLGDGEIQAAVFSKLLPRSIADLACLVVPSDSQDDSEEPVIVTKGVLRVAARFTGEAVDKRNRLTDGRISIARMVGFGPDSRRAHLALIELSSSICRPVGPDCTRCPISAWCSGSSAEVLEAERLPFIAS